MKAYSCVCVCACVCVWGGVCAWILKNPLHWNLLLLPAPGVKARAIARLLGATCEGEEKVQE